jgi:hypothetical protein
MEITFSVGRGGYSKGPWEQDTSAKEAVMAQNKTWNDEDNWWRNNYSSRPYATGRNYEDFRPAYQYGFESGQHHMGRQWNDVEADLRSGWDKVGAKSGTGGTWDSVKDAVKDAWHRITGQHDVNNDKMAEFGDRSRSGKTF